MIVKGLIVRNFLISLFCVLFSTVSAFAEDEMYWHLVVDNSEKILLDKVCMLIAADDNNNDMTVICRDGGMITHVERVSFLKAELENTTNVKNVGIDVPALYFDASQTITLSPVHACGSYSVYSANGVMCMQGVMDGRNIRIDVSALQSGVYVLRVGDNSLKFYKR